MDDHKPEVSWNWSHGCKHEGCQYASPSVKPGDKVILRRQSAGTHVDNHGRLHKCYVMIVERTAISV